MNTSVRVVTAIVSIGTVLAITAYFVWSLGTKGLVVIGAITVCALAFMLISQHYYGGVISGMACILGAAIGGVVVTNVTMDWTTVARFVTDLNIPNRIAVTWSIAMFGSAFWTIVMSVNDGHGT